MSDTRGPDDMFLDGKLLIAMPGMGDPRFARAVIYLCAHSTDGAMGLVVNKPAPDLDFGSLLRQLKIELGKAPQTRRVHFGGPVECGRGFVLHSSDYEVEGASLKVNGAFAMTATVEILKDMARGTGPEHALLALGYAGWGPGQLEAEIQANGWLVAAGDPAVVFEADDAVKWTGALRSLSIDPRLLSGEGGRA